eukprot:455235-Hanusia_phi.AAC.1
MQQTVQQLPQAHHLVADPLAALRRQRGRVKAGEESQVEGLEEVTLRRERERHQVAHGNQHALQLLLAEPNSLPARPHAGEPLRDPHALLCRLLEVREPNEAGGQVEGGDGLVQGDEQPLATLGEDAVVLLLEEALSEREAENELELAGKFARSVE